MKRHGPRKTEPVIDHDIEFEKLKKFEAAETEKEKMQIFSSMLSDDYKLAALDLVPKNQIQNYLHLIKDVDKTVEALNKLESISDKRNAVDYLSLRLKGNSDKLLKLFANIDFKVHIHPDMELMKLNNLNALDIDTLTSIQRNVLNSSYIKFKLTDRAVENVEYSFAEMSAIVIKLQELTAGIDSKASEMSKFETIYERMTSKITYDYDCIRETDKLEKYRDKSYKEHNYEEAAYFTRQISAKRREPAGLYGGLVNGKAICAGYALILNMALQRVGIKAKYIAGYPKRRRTWTCLESSESR